MFIQEVIAKIRAPYTLQFKKAFQAANQMETEELFQLILKEIENIPRQNPLLQDETADFRITTLGTVGCPHWMDNGKFTGCAMCNFMMNYLDGHARLSVLKKRDKKLYAKALRYSFEIQRGKNTRAVPFETVTGYDTLSHEEIPGEIFNDLFAKGDLFETQPHRYEFDTRAASVNPERIREIKKILGKRVSCGLGVEVGDEWIRNHWLNKNSTNQEYEAAVQLLKKEGMGVSAYLLIDIPGLTDEQSRQLFYQSVDWLEKLDVDHMVCTPVVKLEKTLQALIYDHLIENRKLIELGIVAGKQTGIFRIFTVFESLYYIYREKPSLIRILNLSNINFYKYLFYWKKAALSRTVLRILDAVKEFYFGWDLEVLKSVIDYLKKDGNYMAYKEFLKSQKGLEDLRDNIGAAAEEIARKLWPEKWQTKIEGFKKELSSYDRTSINKRIGTSNT